MTDELNEARKLAKLTRDSNRVVGDLIGPGLEDAVREMHEIGLGSVVALRREGCATHPPYATLVVVGPDAIAMVGAVSEVLLRGKA